MTSTAFLVHLATIATATAVVWLLPRINRDTLPFGVRVPPDRVSAPEVADTTRGFRRAVLATGALALVASAVLWPVLPSRVVMGTVGVLLAAGLVGCYTRAHHAVRRAKTEGDWYAGLRQGVAVDTSLRTTPFPLPWLGVVPSLLVIAASAVVGAVLYPGMPDRLVTSVQYRGDEAEYTTTATTLASAFAPVIFQVAVTAALLLLLWLTTRARADGDAARPREDADRHRRFLRIWARTVLASALLVNLALGALALLLWTDSIADAGPAVVALVAVPTALAGLLVLGVALLIGQGGWRMRADADDGAGTGLVQRDDDRYWRLGGFVYVNRNVPAPLVPRRAGGLGWTVNLGHPAVWVVLGLVVVSIVVPAAFAALGIVDLGGSEFYGWQLELDEP